jgi:hypothetical protein
MNIKLIVAAAIAAALVAGFLLADRSKGQTADDLQIVAVSKQIEPASAESATPSHIPGRALSAASKNDAQSVEIHDSQNTEDAAEAPRWSDGIENMIFDYLSTQEGFEFTNIASVECEVHTCEIVFSGLNPNPTTVGDYGDIMSGLFLPPISAGQGRIFTREIVAGAREFVIEISNVPYVEPTVKQ